jgi:hypothetical protein
MTALYEQQADFLREPYVVEQLRTDLGQRCRMADRVPGRDAGVAAKARLAEIYTSERFSDHATLIIDYSARLQPVARESENEQGLRQLSPG